MDQENQNVGRITWNSKLIVTIIAISALTVLGAVGSISGEVALSAIIALAGGYTAYREITSPHRKP